MKRMPGSYVTLDLERYKFVIALADSRTAVRLWLEAKRNYRESGATYGELVDLVSKNPRNLERALQTLLGAGEIYKKDGRYYPSDKVTSVDGYGPDVRAQISNALPAPTPVECPKEALPEGHYLSLKEKKEEKKKKERNTSIRKSKDIEIPAVLAGIHGFNEAWERWQTYRLELRRPLTLSTARLQLGFLGQQKDPLAVIQQSIERGWQGLFALKGFSPSKKAQFQNPDYWSGSVVSTGLYEPVTAMEAQ